MKQVPGCRTRALPPTHPMGDEGRGRPREGRSRPHRADVFTARPGGNNLFVKHVCSMPRRSNTRWLVPIIAMVCAAGIAGCARTSAHAAHDRDMHSMVMHHDQNVAEPLTTHGADVVRDAASLAQADADLAALRQLARMRDAHTAAMWARDITRRDLHLVRGIAAAGARDQLSEFDTSVAQLAASFDDEGMLDRLAHLVASIDAEATPDAARHDPAFRAAVSSELLTDALVIAAHAPQSPTRIEYVHGWASLTAARAITHRRLTDELAGPLPPSIPPPAFNAIATERTIIAANDELLTRSHISMSAPPAPPNVANAFMLISMHLNMIRAQGRDAKRSFISHALHSAHKHLTYAAPTLAQLDPSLLADIRIALDLDIPRAAADSQHPSTLAAAIDQTNATLKRAANQTRSALHQRPTSGTGHDSIRMPSSM